MEGVHKKPAIMDNIRSEQFLGQIKESIKQLELIMKNLEDYLDLKRTLFPRFYFLSNDELLEIFSQTTNPHAVQPHLRKCFDNIKSIKISEKEGVFSIDAMVSVDPDNDQEVVPFVTPILVEGPVERWLLKIEEEMVASLYHALQTGLKSSAGQTLLSEDVLFSFPAQIVLAINMVKWTFGTEEAIFKNKVGIYCNQMREKISSLVKKIIEDLTIGQRELIKSLIVLDVHNRDVVDKLSEQHFLSLGDFQWRKQLRYYWELPQNQKFNNTEAVQNLFIKQTNTSLLYGYEYLGNSPRLVITPLTDKCYLTLTSALSL